MEITKKYIGNLPEDYLEFLKNNPEGNELPISEGADFEVQHWSVWGEKELLESWEMFDVGTAMNFECLKLYVQVQREMGGANWTESNVGNVKLERVESGFVIGSENGDYIYLDPADNYSVWIYYHDGGDVLKVAESFSDLINT